MLWAEGIDRHFSKEKTGVQQEKMLISSTLNMTQVHLSMKQEHSHQ